MKRVTIKAGFNKHFMGDKIYRPGDEFEVTESQFAAFRDKLEPVKSAAELAAIAEARAKEAEEDAKAAAEKAEADKKTAELALKAARGGSAKG